MKVTAQSALPPVTLVIELTADEANEWSRHRCMQEDRITKINAMRHRRGFMGFHVATPISRVNDAIHAELLKRGYK